MLRYVMARTVGSLFNRQSRSDAFSIATAVVLLTMSAIGIAAADSKDYRLVMSAKAQGAAVYQSAEWPRCAEAMKFIVLATSDQLYSGNFGDLQKIISGLRAVTGITCKALKGMEIYGFTKDKLVFTGVARASDGWRLQRVQQANAGGAGQTGGGSTQGSQGQKPQPAQQARPAPTSKPVVGDQQFFAALSRGGGQDQQPIVTPAPSDFGTVDVTSGDASGGGSALPARGTGTGQEDALDYRSVYEFRKLSRNLDHLLGINLDTLSEVCANEVSSGRFPSRVEDILLRLCRATEYSRNQTTLAKDYEQRIAED